MISHTSLFAVLGWSSTSHGHTNMQVARLSLCSLEPKPVISHGKSMVANQSP